MSVEYLQPPLNIVSYELQRKRERFLANLTMDGRTRYADLPNLTPSELNQQLLILYKRLPKLIVPEQDFSEKKLDFLQKRAAKRINSDKYLPYTAWFQALLNQAPTTPGCDFYLLYILKRLYGFGVAATDSENPISFILEKKDFQSGGIFDPEIALRKEQILYHRLVEEESWWTQFLNKTIDRLTIGPAYLFLEEKEMKETYIETFGRIVIPRVYTTYKKAEIPDYNPRKSYNEIVLNRWRQDFIAKYGDEP